MAEIQASDLCDRLQKESGGGGVSSQIPRGFHREAAASHHSRPSRAPGHGTDRSVPAGAGGSAESVTLPLLSRDEQRRQLLSKVNRCNLSGRTPTGASGMCCSLQVSEAADACLIRVAVPAVSFAGDCLAHERPWHCRRGLRPSPLRPADTGCETGGGNSHWLKSSSQTLQACKACLNETEKRDEETNLATLHQFARTKR